MAENGSVSKSKLSADWFVRGALSRIGDIFDRVTGRKWTPSSSLATSELIERMKRLMDAETVEVTGKGHVAPHKISLRMQWDKFSTDSEESLERLQRELLTAAADHINDRLYYTYAPLEVDVRSDYFTEGVKLQVGFGTFAKERDEAELNVTVAGLDTASLLEEAGTAEPAPKGHTLVAEYKIGGADKEKRLRLCEGARISVGRSPMNDLVLDDPSVSKIHAALVIGSEGTLSLADTGSTNGTFINGQRISYGVASRLSDDDKVKFGAVEVKLSRVETDETEIEEIAEVEASGERVSIGGFEFTTRITPTDEEAEKLSEKAGDETDSDANSTTENSSPADSNGSDR